MPCQVLFSQERQFLPRTRRMTACCYQRTKSCPLPAKKLLALACLLAVCSFLFSKSSNAADANRLAWSPSRDEAIVMDGFPVTAMPADSTLGKPLLSQRPRSLSRPAPTRSHSYSTSAPGAASMQRTISGSVTSETLPSISGTPMSPDGLPVPPEMYYDEGAPLEGDVPFGDANCRPCGPCGRGGWGGVGGCMWVPLCVFLPVPPLDGFEFFSGTQGFTGPANRGASGSFGFHEGFNLGLPIAGFMNGQFGANWTQNNFDGSFLTGDQRNQIFATAGLSRRVDWGFQGGLVVDYFHDEWDYSADLLQLRGELSWLWCGCNEIGFWFAAGVNDAENLQIRRPVVAGENSLRFITSQSTLEVNDLYAFFFRRQFACGGQGRLFGGFTSNSQGLVGGDATLPINPNFSLRSSFIYVTTEDSDSPSDPRFSRESWNVGISLVWTPCARPASGCNYSRPLFNVADNGTFLTRLVGQ
jgi:hypothetical protein